MYRNIVPIDISNAPDLLRIAQEVQITKTPRLLRRDQETIAMVMPIATVLTQKSKKAKSQRHYKAFLKTAGSLQGLIDVEKLHRAIAESRKLSTRPAFTL